ncbi:MAG: hypothetical protein HWN68_20835 [Desulfobacterales bacterium]|nr:hypothetical protein [Desulfobacterales bacterium]
MATKAGAKKKYVDKVTSDLATKSMATKLSTYLGISVSETASPIKNYKDKMKDADELFDRLYEGQKAAYM